MTCSCHLQEDKHSHKGILLEAAKKVYVRALQSCSQFASQSDKAENKKKINASRNNSWKSG